MKKTIITILIVFIILTLVFFSLKIFSTSILSDLLGVNKTENKETLLSEGVTLENKQVPFFDLPGLDNNRIKSSQFIDKPFIVVFFASYNIESLNQLKIIDEYISKENKIDKLVSFIAINSQEESSVVKSFMRRAGYEIPTAIDSKGDTGEFFHIKSLPTTFFIDRDGVIKEIYSGVLNRSMLGDKIEQLLN